MNQFAKQCLKVGLTTLHFSGAGYLASRVARGQGVVLMLHHVRPANRQSFDPNALLSITPQFLEKVVTYVRRSGFDIVSLDEAHDRMLVFAEGDDLGGKPRARTKVRPFACFTFDDGYRDNRDFAFPVLKRYGVPLAVYVATDFADGRGFLWWLVLERVIRTQASVALRLAGVERSYRCKSTFEKRATFEQLYWWLRRIPEAEARGIVLALAHKAGIDAYGPCKELVMSWPELREFAADPLVTIGAHSVRHMAMGRLSETESRGEIRDSVSRIERELGKPCRHFCYPYGNAVSAGEREFTLADELGVATAVTTRKGVVPNDPAMRLTALPRVSLNGEYQKLRYVKPLLSGLPFALWNALSVSRAGRRSLKPIRPALPRHDERSNSAGATADTSRIELPSAQRDGASVERDAAATEAGSVPCIQRTSSAAGQTQANPPTM